jgi:carboxylate-amine ligase
VVENKWRAQRYGVHGTFVGDHGAITVADFVEQVVDETSADAGELGCLAELQRCRTIVGSGTSADAQIAVYERFGKTEGRDRALSAVTDWLAATTLQ